jgi:hypothetical protein
VIRLVAGLAAAGLLSVASGCREPHEPVATTSITPAESSSPSTSAAAYRQQSPQEYLRNVLANYQRATAYHDAAVVRLSYQSGVDTESTTAPLHVFFDGEELFVQAYDVQFFADKQGTMAWIADPATHGFDSQVLRTAPLSGRPTLTSILADPILREHMSAGLAGPPPQLEWLFSTEPPTPLFRAEHQFSFERDANIEGRLCRGVRVQAGAEQYRFWVDHAAAVIRQIEFPRILVPTVADGTPVVMNLTLELRGASFAPPRQAPDVKPLPKQPLYVSRFVPLPPVEPPEFLGTQPAAFQVTTADGQIRVSDRGDDRMATAIVRVAGDQPSLAALETLQHWHNQIPASLLANFRTVVLSPAEIAAALSQRTSLPVVIDRNDSASQALSVASGAIVIQDKSGRLAWEQSDFSQTGLVSLGAIIADIINGIDVPSRVRTQWQQQVDAYEQSLRAAKN